MIGTRTAVESIAAVARALGPDLLLIDAFRDSILGHLAGHDDDASALLAWIGGLVEDS